MNSGSNRKKSLKIVKVPKRRPPKPEDFVKEDWLPDEALSFYLNKHIDNYYNTDCRFSFIIDDSGEELFIHEKESGPEQIHFELLELGGLIVKLFRCLKENDFSKLENLEPAGLQKLKDCSMYLKEKIFPLISEKIYDNDKHRMQHGLDPWLKALGLPVAENNSGNEAVFRIHNTNDETENSEYAEKIKLSGYPAELVKHLDDKIIDDLNGSIFSEVTKTCGKVTIFRPIRLAGGRNTYIVCANSIMALIGYEILELSRLRTKFMQCANCGSWYIPKIRQCANYCPNCPVPSKRPEIHSEQQERYRLRGKIASGKMTEEEAAQKKGMDVEELRKWLEMKLPGKKRRGKT